MVRKHLAPASLAGQSFEFAPPMKWYNHTWKARPVLLTSYLYPAPLLLLQVLQRAEEADGVPEHKAPG